MNHNQTLMNLKSGACSFGVFFLGWDESMFLHEKFCAASCRLVVFSAAEQSAWKKNPREIEIWKKKTEETCSKFNLIQRLSFRMGRN